ncbi:MAG: hypothetical protein GDA65_02630 [Nitrospira sp. CR1.1]|nr:hypothetical protein [Nitrospira sp. CR1.1]
MVPPPPGRPGLMLLFCLAVGIAEAAPAPTEEPDAELLDFLGSWQAEEGRWIDPFTITDNPVAPPPAKPKPDRNGMPAEARKPAKETPSTSAKDHPRDSLRMPTGP